MLIYRIMIGLVLLMLCHGASYSNSFGDSLFDHAKSIYKTDPQKALKLLDEYKSLHEDDLHSVGEANWMIAYIYKTTGDKDLSMVNYFNALQAFEISESKIEQALMMKEIGLCFMHVGSHARAEEYFNKALNIAVDEENQVEIASNHHNLGYNFKLKGDVEKSFLHFQKSLKLRQEMDQYYFVCSNLNEMGQLAFKRGNYAEARKFYFQSLKILDEISHPDLYSWLINNIGNSYLKEDNYDSAKLYLNEAVDLMVKAGELSKVTMVLNNLASLDMDRNPQESHELFLRAHEMIQTDTEFEEVERTYTNLIQIQKAEANIDSAFQLASMLNQLISNERTRQQNLKLADEHYRYERIALEYELLEEQKQRKRQIWFVVKCSIAVILSILLTIGLWYWRVKRSVKSDIMQIVSTGKLPFYVELIMFENEQHKRTISEMQKISKYGEGMYVNRHR